MSEENNESKRIKTMTTSKSRWTKIDSTIVDVLTVNMYIHDDAVHVIFLRDFFWRGVVIFFCGVSKFGHDLPQAVVT